MIFPRKLREVSIYWCIKRAGWKKFPSFRKWCVFQPDLIQGCPRASVWVWCSLYNIRGHLGISGARQRIAETFLMPWLLLHVLEDQRSRSDAIAFCHQVQISPFSSNLCLWLKAWLISGGSYIQIIVAVVTFNITWMHCFWRKETWPVCLAHLQVSVRCQQSIFEIAHCTLCDSFTASYKLTTNWGTAFVGSAIGRGLTAWKILLNLANLGRFQ